MTLHSDPFRIFCKNCGAAAGFDIVRQTYRCPHCGTTSGIHEAREKAESWRALRRDAAAKHDVSAEQGSCTACGAQVLFREGEASERCDFCGGNLVRSAFENAENLPDFVIPFVLTHDEARERLLKWAAENKGKREAKLINGHIGDLQGYYLPYRLVRGPVSGKASRDTVSRTFTCRGFLEHAAVNASSQVDNEVLNEAEPFDWSALVPFEHGFIGGQKVKLCDLPDADIRKLLIKETARDWASDVSRVLQCDDVELVMDGNTDELVNVSALLPVYVLKWKGLRAAVNGQTGRVAVNSTKEARSSKTWLVAPIALTVLAALASLLAFGLDAIPAAIMCTMVAAIVFFAIFSDSRNDVVRRIIYKGQESAAHRQDGELVIDEGKDALKNPFPNDPVFYERDGDAEVPVQVSFYTPGRVAGLIVELVLIACLPLIIAGIWCLATGFPFGQLELASACAWFVLAGGYCIIYTCIAFKRGVYDRPILRELGPDGKPGRLVGSRASRHISLLSLITQPTGDEKVHLRDLGGIGVFFFGLTAFILIGSTAAMFPL